jgi:hypothetical protein
MLHTHLLAPRRMPNVLALCPQAFGSNTFTGIVYVVGGSLWTLESLWSIWCLKGVRCLSMRPY